MSYFFIRQGARREHSLSYVTDEATKTDEKSRRPNREVIIAAFLKDTLRLNPSDKTYAATKAAVNLSWNPFM